MDTFCTIKVEGCSYIYMYYKLGSFSILQNSYCNMDFDEGGQFVQ